MSDRRNYYQRLVHSLLDNRVIAIVCILAVALAAVIGFTDIMLKPYQAWLKWQADGESSNVSVVSLERRDQSTVFLNEGASTSDDYFSDFESCKPSSTFSTFTLKTVSQLRVRHFDSHDRYMGNSSPITEQPAQFPMRLVLRNDNAFPIVFRGLHVSVDLSYFEAYSIKESQGPGVLESSGALSVFVGSYPNSFSDRYPEGAELHGNAWQATYNLLDETKAENSLVAIPAGQLASFDVDLNFDDFPLCHKVEFGLLVDDEVIFVDPFVVEVVSERSSQQVDECLDSLGVDLLDPPDVMVDLKEPTELRRWLSANCDI